MIDACTDPEAIALLERISTSKADFPLVICPGGTVMRTPDENQLASQLGWLPEFDPAHIYDVAVVGAGPARLATAVYAASKGLSGRCSIAVPRRASRREFADRKLSRLSDRHFRSGIGWMRVRYRR